MIWSSIQFWIYIHSDRLSGKTSFCFSFLVHIKPRAAGLLKGSFVTSVFQMFLRYQALGLPWYKSSVNQYKYDLSYISLLFVKVTERCYYSSSHKNYYTACVICKYFVSFMSPHDLFSRLVQHLFFSYMFGLTGYSGDGSPPP